MESSALVAVESGLLVSNSRGKVAAGARWGREVPASDIFRELLCKMEDMTVRRRREVALRFPLVFCHRAMQVSQI